MTWNDWLRPLTITYSRAVLALLSSRASSAAPRRTILPLGPYIPGAAVSPQLCLPLCPQPPAAYPAEDADQRGRQAAPGGEGCVRA